MKFSLLFVALVLVPTLSIAQNVVSRSTLFDGTEYRFPLSNSELAKSPVWKTTAAVPPLDPRKAASLAKDFLDKLTKGKTSVGKEQIAWSLDSIILQKVSDVPKRWIYKIHFDQDISASDAWIGPTEQFEIVVYLSGNIVDPIVSSSKGQ